MKKRLKGSITVFYAAVSLSLIMLFGTLLDGVRAFESKKTVAEYEYLSLDNRLAGYVRELWDDYHLLFMDERQLDKDTAGAGKMPDGFLSVTVKEKEVLPENYFYEQGVYTGQIADYMKYASIPALVEIVSSGAKTTEENIKADEGLKARLKAEEQCVKTESTGSRALNKVSDMAKKQSDFLSNNELSTDDNEGTKSLIYSHVCSLLSDSEKYEKEYEISAGLMKEYESISKADNDYSELKSIMSSSKDRVRGTSAVLAGNEAKLLRIKEMCEDENVPAGSVISLLNSVSYPEAESNAKTSEDPQKEYKNKLNDLLSRGVAALVLPDGYDISKKKIKNLKKTPDSFTTNVENSPLTSIYLYSHFGNFISKNQKETALDYELEYLICGKKEDEDNLKGVLDMLLGVRTGANLVKILKDPQRVAAAGNLALATAGASGNAAVVFAVKTAIITYWATKDAVDDLKKLWSGEAVDGLSYEQYLMTLLMAKKGEKKLIRSAHLMEENLKTRYDEGFSLDKLYSKISRKTEVTIHGTFTKDLVYRQVFSRSF